MADERRENETEEEARERIAQVRATQIFGDTPTDPTIGDVVVPAHDEEAANVVASEVDSRADDGDEDAEDLSPEEAKRQLEPLDAEDVDEGAEDREDDESGDLFTSDDSDDSDDSADESDDLTAAEKIDKIEAASSVEEVDSLAEGDERVTVQRAADKRREELA